MFRYLFIPTDTPFEIPKELVKFKCLILVEREVSAAFQCEVSKALIEAGCLYTLARGIECTTWDDSVDWAFIQHYQGNYTKDEHVMTTWHEDETLEETIEFAKVCTDYAEVKLENILVLDFGTRERARFIETFYENV